MPHPIRLAICGLGLVGQRHAEAIAQVPEAGLAAVVDPAENGRALAAARGIPCHDSIDAMFDAQPVDGVILSTPTPLHVEQALGIVARGCPVLVEKPIATTARDARVLVEASEARGVPVLVGHHRRHNPLIRKAHEVISGGQIGKVRAVQATCWFYKPDAYFDAAPWRKKTGAGPISVNLVHDVDLIRHLCGEVASVRAVATPSARGFENEDTAAAVLEFDSGAVGTITVSDSIVAPWSWELTSRENPVYPPTPESCYLIGGSHGALSVPDLRVWNHSGGAQDWWEPISATTLPRGASDPLVNQIRHLAAVVRGEARPLVPAAEGLRTLQVVEAIQQAAATGQTVPTAGWHDAPRPAEKQAVE